MLLAHTRPADWLLPGLLALAWFAFLVARRGVPPWFFAVAAVLAVLCFPAGMIAGRRELAGVGCTPDNLCFSTDEVGWWWNGILGLLATGAMALLTGVAAAVRAAVRRRR